MIAYLLASLPTPRLTQPPAVGPGAFLDGCRTFVGEARWRDLAEVLAARHVTPSSPRGVNGESDDRSAPGARPDGEQPDPSARAWADWCAQIDDAVAVQRAAISRRDPTPYLRRPSGYRVDVVEGVERAFAAVNPAARERALDELRWRLADELASSEPDGFAALYARAVQLHLAWRWARWDAEAGWSVLDATLRELEAPHA